MKKLAIVLIVVLTIAFVACGNGSTGVTESGSSTQEAAAEPSEAPVTPTENIRIGYACYDYTLEIWAGITNELVRECKDLGWEITTVTCDEDPKKQVEAIENYTAAEVDGIISACTAIDAITGAVVQATEMGIPVVGLFYPFDELSAYAGVESYQTGYAAGKAAAEYINEYYTDATESNPVQVCYMKNPITDELVLRAQGVHDGLADFAEYPFDMVAEPIGGGAQAYMDALETVLQQYPDLNIFIANGSSGIEGAINACKGAGVGPEDIAMFSCDTIYSVLEYMAKGEYVWHTSSYGNSREMAMPGVELMKSLLEGGAKPEPYYMPVFSINRDNVDDLMDAYNIVIDQTF